MPLCKHLKPYFEFPVLVSVRFEELLDGFPLVRQICLCQLSAKPLQHLCNVFDCYSKTFYGL